MHDHRTTPQSIKKSVVETKTTTYFTIKGKEDRVENGFPVQDKENQFTYAKQTGLRKMVRIDDRGELMNPIGMYPQKIKLDRWISISNSAFQSYLDFLRTKNALFLRQAQRNAV